MPSWYTEGVADLLSHHVWEAGRQRLTLNVLDKATDINWLDRALRRFGERRFTATDIARGTVRDRDVGFLLVAYFMTDVERSLKFRIYRDELFRLNLNNNYQERSDALIEESVWIVGRVGCRLRPLGCGSAGDIPPGRVGLGAGRRHPPVLRLAE